MYTGREWGSRNVRRPAYAVDKLPEYSIRPEPEASQQELDPENFIQIRGRSETHITSNGSLTGPLTKERKNMASRLTGRLSLLFLSFVAVLLIFPAMAFAQTTAPTIQSDKDDYSPGSLV